MKCLTDSAIELTCPGVPVTACASMRPCVSKIPAERSPASRTVVLNDERISVCACSSTMASRRFHITCIRICASGSLVRVISSSFSSCGAHAFEVAETVHLHIEFVGYDRGGLVLDHDRGAGEHRAGPE